MYHQHSALSEIRYAQPILTGKGELLDPTPCFTPKINSNNILYQSLFKTFDREQLLYPRLPVDMGNWNQLNQIKSPNVLRLPLKNKGPREFVYLPEALAELIPLLKFVINYEKMINPQYEDTFCHMTVDRSNIEPGQYHRFPGFHTDGFQGTKLTPKLLPEHSYIFVSSPPTELCLQPFFLQHLDEAKHNMFLEMDRQARAGNIYNTLPNHLYLFDPYVVHRSPLIKKQVERLFVRITFTFSELEHPKNTKNPMMESKQYAERVEIREHLGPADFNIPYGMYGVKRRS